MWGVDAGGGDVRRDECIARLAAAGSSGRGGPTFEHTQGGEGRSDPDIALRGKKTRNISHRLRFYRLPMWRWRASWVLAVSEEEELRAK